MATPRVSNENPFSEAPFKTLKYRPDFPARFGSLQDTRSHCSELFLWCNTELRHSGIGWHTPDQAHYQTSGAWRQKRADTLMDAWRPNPEPFLNGQPVPPACPRKSGSTAPFRRRKAKQKGTGHFR